MVDIQNLGEIVNLATQNLDSIAMAFVGFNIGYDYAREKRLNPISKAEDLKDTPVPDILGLALSGSLFASIQTKIPNYNHGLLPYASMVLGYWLGKGIGMNVLINRKNKIYNNSRC